MMLTLIGLSEHQANLTVDAQHIAINQPMWFLRQEKLVTLKTSTRL